MGWSLNVFDGRDALQPAGRMATISAATLTGMSQDRSLAPRLRERHDVHDPTWKPPDGVEHAPSLLSRPSLDHSPLRVEPHRPIGGSGTSSDADI